jgi:hypothetical protein
LYKNLDGKMTRESYFNMCEQLGTEPDPKHIPPDMDDLPEAIQVAMIIFNTLGDRVYPEIGYIGKDYTNLPILFDIYGVEDRELALDVLTFLDSRAIKASSEEIKRQLEKLKRKNNG